MPVYTYRGEATVGEIADRLYTRLTPRQRKKVETALLKANPRLRDVSTLERGALLRVPDIAELRNKRNDDGGHVNAEIAERVTAAVTAYGARLRGRFERDEADVKAQITTLKNRRLKVALESAPAAKELAAQATAHLKQRARAAANRQAAVDDALNKAITDIKKLV